MDPLALATLLQSGGPWALLSLSLFANKYLYDQMVRLQDKIEGILGEWRKDSQAQGDKLASILERAASDNDTTPKRGR